MVIGAIRDVSPLAYLAAFGGGIISFLTPCTLPLLPVYLSMITGLDIATLTNDARTNTRTIVRTTSLFIAGLGLVFVPLGLTSSAIGEFLFDNQTTMTRVGGALVFAFALLLGGSAVFQSSWLTREHRLHPRLAPLGRVAPLVAGMAFAFGWSPCIGPILGSILGIAQAQGRAAAGASLLAAYTLGLGLPFLACGLGLARLGGALNWVRRHFTAITIGSAMALAAFGILMMTNQLVAITRELSAFTRWLGIDNVVG